MLHDFRCEGWQRHLSVVFRISFGALFKDGINIGSLPGMWQSSRFVKLLEKGREYNGEF